MPFSAAFSVILSTHSIWSLKLDAKTPEFSPFASEGSVDCSPERGCQHQGGATSNTSVPAGPGSLSTREDVMGSQGTRNKSESDQELQVSGIPVTMFCPISTMRVCKFIWLPEDL